MFIIVFQDRGVVLVSLFNNFCHSFFIHCKCYTEQLFRLMNRINNIFLATIFNGVKKFLLNLIIRNADHLCIEIEGQVAKMYQECKNIIRTVKRGHIVLKFSGIHLNRFCYCFNLRTIYGLKIGGYTPNTIFTSSLVCER